jgi:IclR family transcriptional regulator, KDG regulon repressor
MADSGADSGGVRSVQLALDVLEAVAFSNDELGVTQIADRLGVAKGSVYRHLSTLVDRGYLNQNAVTARYSVGPKSRVLARIAPETDLVQIAEGPMRELRDKIGQTVVLSSLTPRGALVIFAVPSTSPIEIGVRPGSELSFHSSAQGKVLLAFSPRPFQERVLSRELTKLTDKTVIDREELERELFKVQKEGYAAAPEEALLGVNAIAGPVFDKQDAVIAAVALVGSIQFLPPTPDNQLISALKDCCEQISRKFGHGRGDGALYPAARRAHK